MEKAKLTICRVCEKEVHPADIIFDPHNDRIGCCFCLDILPKLKERTEEFVKKQPSPAIEKSIMKSKNKICRYCKFSYYYNIEKDYPKNCPNCKR